MDFSDDEEEIDFFSDEETLPEQTLPAQPQIVVSQSAQPQIVVSQQEPKIFFKTFEKMIEKDIRRTMELYKKKITRKQRIEFQNRKKNILFNCIRSYHNEPIRTYEQDKKDYFNNILSFVSTTGEIANVPTPQCYCENPRMGVSSSAVTCTSCGKTFNIPELAVSFSHQHHSLQGSKDLLGWYFDKKDPKDYITNLMTVYLESSPFFYSEENIKKLKDKIRASSKTNRKELKEEAFKIIQDDRPAVFQEETNRYILADSLELDHTVLNSIKAPKVKEDLYKIVLGFSPTSSQLRKFKKWQKFFEKKEYDEKNKNAFILWKSLNITQKEATQAVKGSKITEVSKLKKDLYKNHNKEIQKLKLIL